MLTFCGHTFQEKNKHVFHYLLCCEGSVLGVFLVADGSEDPAALLAPDHMDGGSL